jgi:hypothetical protein
MKPKLIKIPRRLLPKAGAHIVVPGSTLGGTRKSTMIITAACVCALAGLNFTVVTLDPYYQPLQRALGDVVAIPSITSESGRQSLREIFEQAKTNQSIILMDMPGMLIGYSETQEIIRSHCDLYASVGMITPISSDQWNQECALSVIELLQPDRVLVNYCETLTSRRLPPAIMDKLSQYPCWESDRWTQGQKNVAEHRGAYADLPVLTKIPAYLTTNWGTLDQSMELDLEDFIHDIEIAGGAIYEHLLKPITTVVAS